MTEPSANAKQKEPWFWVIVGVIFLLAFAAIMAGIYFDCPFIQRFEGWEGLIAAGFAGAVAWTVGYRTVHKIGDQVRQAQAAAKEAREDAQEQRKAFDRQMRWQTADWRRNLEMQLQHHLEQLQPYRETWPSTLEKGDRNAVYFQAQGTREWFQKALIELSPQMWHEEISNLRSMQAIIHRHLDTIQREKNDRSLEPEILIERYADIVASVDEAYKTLEATARELRDYDGSGPIG